MDWFLKRVVWTSSETLKVAGITVQDAVIIGTDFGCIDNFEHFLQAVVLSSNPKGAMEELSL